MIKHTIRTSNNGRREVELNPKLAIKLFCVECSCFESHPKDCTQTTCPLFPFRGYSRLSSENYVKKEVSEEQKERFKQVRKVRKI